MQKKNIRRCTATLAALLTTLFFPSLSADAAESERPEPNLEIAKEWWPDLTDYWTPVGWKHHRFRYNVFFDGTIYADPGLSQTATDWKDQGVQLRVVPIASTNVQTFNKQRSERYALEDDRSTHQSWTTNKTPVLWTEWAKGGMLLRENIFAHIPGGSDVQTGLEPLFAWVRFSIHDIAPALPIQDRFTFSIQINSPHVKPTMHVRKNIQMLHDRASYPRELKVDGKYDRAKGLRIVEPDGKVRLAIAPGLDVEAGFLAGDGKEKDPLLYITIDTKKGNYVDVLVPMIPTERAILDKELSHGYDKALAESEIFWSKRPATAATIDVPETYINDTIQQFERFVEVLSEREPETGKNITLSGSLAYVKIWATPTGKMVSMFLDPLGYHDLAEEYLEPFILAQGTIKPPSAFLEKHHGYLGSPIQFKSIDWMADHGSLLFAIANHALQISDPQLKKRYAEPIVKACEFIQQARRATNHDGVKGILPPARYSDAHAQTQGVWSDGWNYKGLSTGARLLRQINHPRAAEFIDEAADYKKDYVSALREAAKESGTWTDEKGKVHPLVPTSLYGAEDESLRHAFYLDTGPMQLVFAGLLEADDPLMISALKWFREGPVQDFVRFGASYSQLGFLRHEMSSCIPGYSWNIFHNHQLGDRYRFLEGMYSQYAGAISRQTKTVCETRGGITGRITHADTPFYMTRLAVIDDIIADNELHLLRLCPLAWISSERETKFEKMPTAYGPVSLRWQSSKDGKTLRVDYAPQFHTKPDKVILHLPPIEGLKTISINGKERSVKSGGQVTL